MRRVCLSIVVGIAALASMSFAQQGPYQVLKVVGGGAGGFDYVYADEAGCRLYIAAGAAPPSGAAPWAA